MCITYFHSVTTLKFEGLWDGSGIISLNLVISIFRFLCTLPLNIIYLVLQVMAGRVKGGA